MEITPKNNFVLCEFIEWTTISNSKILMASMGKEPDMTDGGVLRVIACGRGRYLDSGEIVPIDCQPGDEVVVFMNQQAMSLPPFMYGDKKYVLVNADFIVATVDRTGDSYTVTPKIAVPRKELVH